MTGPLAPILSRAIYLRSFLHGTTGFFYHQASGLKADLLDGLGRRRARFGMESAAKLAGRECRDLSQFLHGQRIREVSFRMYQRLLNALAAGHDPDLERWMYNRAGSTVTEIWSSQAIYISQAAAVAKVIQEAAKAAK